MKELASIGFIFAPTDELCISFLSAKFHGLPLPCKDSDAGEVDLYSASPWEILGDDDPHWIIVETPSSKKPLKEKIKIKKTIYVFTKLYNKATKSGTNKNRTAGSGTWTVQNNNPVMNQRREIIGRNKYLGFYREGSKNNKRKNGGDEDSWSMHEYTLAGDDEKFKNYAFCKITKEVTIGKNQCVPTAPPAKKRNTGISDHQVSVPPPRVNHQVIKDSVNVHNYQTTSTALIVADGKNGNQEVESSFNMEPAASSLDSEIPSTLDDVIDLGFLDNGISVEQVPLNLDTQVASEVFQEFPVVVVNDQSNYLGDGDQQSYELDRMPSLDGEFGADMWSLDLSVFDDMFQSVDTSQLPPCSYINLDEDQPSSTALIVADGKNGNQEPAASSLDSKNNRSFMEEIPSTLDDVIDLGLLDNGISIEQDSQVPCNLETTDTQVASEVIKNWPVVVVKVQEEVNPRDQERNVRDRMPSLDGEFGADMWSLDLSVFDDMFQSADASQLPPSYINLDEDQETVIDDILMIPIYP